MIEGNLEMETDFFNELSTSLLELDKVIENLSGNVDRIDCSPQLHTPVNNELEKAITDQTIMKAKIQEKLDALSAKTMSEMAFKNYLNSLKDWMDDSIVTYNSIMREDAIPIKLEKQQKLLNELLESRPNVDQLKTLASETGLQTSQESATDFIKQYDKLLQNIDKDMGMSENQMEVYNYYVNSMKNSENRLHVLETSLQELRSRSFAGVENVANSKLQALDIQRKTFELQDQLYLLDQKYGHKISAYLEMLQMDQQYLELTRHIEKFSLEVNKYIENCDKELELLSSYNRKTSLLKESVNNINLDLDNVGKSMDYNKQLLKEIQDLRSKIIDAENVLDEVKTMSDSSNVLSRTPKTQSFINNIQPVLDMITDKSENLLDKLNAQILICEKLSNLDNSLKNKMENIQEEMDGDKDNLSNQGFVEKLAKKSKTLHKIHEEISNMLYNEMDKHSNRYLEFCDRHRDRTKGLQLIDNKIHEMASTLKQRNDEIVKYDAKHEAIEDNLKSVENKLELVTQPKDLIFLQNNEVILRSLIFDLENIELKQKELKSDLRDKPSWLPLKNSTDSIDSLKEKTTSLKQTIQNTLKDYDDAKNEIKNHQISMETAKNFISHCHRKFSKDLVGNKNIYQIESELSKNKELLSSVDKNEKLLSNCSTMDMSQLRCISDKGMTIIQMDINELSNSYQSLKKALKDAIKMLEILSGNLKEKSDMEENLSKWLKKEEKKIKLNGQINDHDAIGGEIQRLTMVLEELSERRNKLDSIPSGVKTVNDNSEFRYSNVNERCEKLSDFIEEKIKQLQTLSTDFKRFDSLLQDWKRWYDNTSEEKKHILKKHNINTRNLLEKLQNQKNEKFEQVLNISSCGEGLLPVLTVHGREKIKSQIKINKEQWHELFDDLPILLEVLEEQMKTTESLIDKTDKFQIQFESFHLSLMEEIDEIEPLKIHYQIGMKNKNRQLQKLSELKQKYNILDYEIRRLESTVELIEDPPLKLMIRTLSDQFKSSMELLENTKSLCLSSCQNHQIFESTLLEIQDYLNSMEKKISLCENMEGTENSLEARMERIKIVLTKELINTEYQTNQVFSQLKSAFNSVFDTVGEAERKSFKDQLNLMYSAREDSDDKLKNFRISLESSYKELEHFKLMYDLVLKDMANVQNEFQMNSNHEANGINKLLNKTKALSEELTNLHDLGLGIFQETSNSYPLNLAKSLQNRVHYLMGTLETCGFECSQLNTLQTQFDSERADFKGIINSLQEQLKIALIKFNECADFSSLTTIAQGLDQINLQENHNSQSDSIRMILERFSQISPEKYRKNKIQFKKLKNNHEVFCREKSQFTTQLENLCRVCQGMEDELLAIENEFRNLSFDDGREIPDEKLLKFNLINDLTNTKSVLGSFKNRLNEINVQLIPHRGLGIYFQGKKSNQLFSVDCFIDEIENQVKRLNQSLTDQEQLERNIFEIKNTLHQIDQDKQKLSLGIPLNKANLEARCIGVDKNLRLLASVKENIKKFMLKPKVGCSMENSELVTLMEETKNMDLEIRSIKDQINNDIETRDKMENLIHEITRESHRFEEEIESLNTGEKLLGKKTEILEKANDLKERILNRVFEIEGITEEFDSKILNNFSDDILYKSFEKLRNQNLKQTVKIGEIIEKYRNIMSLEDDFEKSYHDLLQEITDKKTTIENLDSLKMKTVIPNLSGIQTMITRLNDLATDLQNVSPDQDRCLIEDKLINIDNHWNHLEKIQHQVQLKKEKEEQDQMEFNRQSKILNERFEEIRKSMKKLKNDETGNVIEKRKKYHDIRQIQNEAKEWKNEINKHFGMMKELVNDDILIEISKDYQELMEELNYEMDKSQLALNDHLEFDNKLEEFHRWLENMADSITDFSMEYDFSIERVDSNLKDFFDFHTKLVDGNTKINLLQHLADCFSTNLSLKGQEIVGETIGNCMEKYLELQDISKQKLKSLELEKCQIEEFCSVLNQYEKWLREKEEIFSNKDLLATFDEKEAWLETYQTALLDIGDEKIKLVNFTENIKNFPWNFSMNHNIKDIQSRYSSLANSAKQRTEIIEKSVVDHRSYNEHKQSFQYMNDSVEKDLKIFKSKIETSQSSDLLVEEINYLNNEMSKIGDLKSVFCRAFKRTLESTNEEGRKKIAKTHNDLLQQYEHVFECFNNLKLSFYSKRTLENECRTTMENLYIWLEAFNEKVQNANPFSQIQISVLQSCSTELAGLATELSQKKVLFKSTLGDYKSIEEENLKELMFTIKRKFQLLNDMLTEKRQSTETLLEINEKYLTSVDNINQWMGNINKNLYEISDLRGSQSLVRNKLESLKTVLQSILTEGKQLMDSAIENADNLNKNLNMENNKEKIVDQISDIEKEFFNLTNKSEKLQSDLDEISDQWQNYNKNIAFFNEVLSDLTVRKNSFKNLECNYSTDLKMEIEKIQEILIDINEERHNLDLFSSQVESLKRISQESQIDIILQDLLDQFDGHELDCKSQIDTLNYINNEKMSLEYQYKMTMDKIHLMKNELLVWDQLNDVGSLGEFQKEFQTFQILDSKIIDGDRMVEDCMQMSHKLLLLLHSDQVLKEMIRKMTKHWNNLKDQLSEVKGKMNRLMDLWMSVDSMKSEIEIWINVANEESQSIIKDGYQNTELTYKNLENLKNLRLNAEATKLKLAKFIELFYKADAYPGFSKFKDPLDLQKAFYETLEKIVKLEKELTLAQSGIGNLFQDIFESDKWIVDMTLLINEELQKVQLINNFGDLKSQVDLCKDVKSQIKKYEQNKIQGLMKTSEEICNSYLKSSPLRSEISGRIINIVQAFKKMISINANFKKSIKQRYNTIKKFQKIIENVETFLYKDLPKCWSDKDTIITKSAVDCSFQIDEVSYLLESAKELKTEFEKVWLDRERQYCYSKSLTKQENESDTFLGDNIISSNLSSHSDDHSNRLKVDLDTSIEKVQQKLQNLQSKKQKWDKIENEIEELSMLFAKQRLRLEHKMSNPDSDVFYDHFEKVLVELILKRDSLEKLHQEIQCLNGKQDPRGSMGITHYKKFSNLCHDYSNLLYEMELYRKNLESIDCHDPSSETLFSEDFTDFTQNVNKMDILSMYPQTGTQTNRDKSTSVRTVRRFASNPNLRESVIKKTQTAKESLKSATTDTRINQKIVHKMSQTVNDIGTQFSKVSNSESSDRVMHGMKVKNKHSKQDQTDSKVFNSTKHKTNRMKRLNQLLGIVRQIKEELSTSNLETSVPNSPVHLSKPRNSLRDSAESIRLNLLSPRNKTWNSLQRMRKSVDSLGIRPSPTGCTSPPSFMHESVKKRPSSPRKSPSKVQGIIAF